MLLPQPVDKKRVPLWFYAIYSPIYSFSKCPRKQWFRSQVGICLLSVSDYRQPSGGFFLEYLLKYLKLHMGNLADSIPQYVIKNMKTKKFRIKWGKPVLETWMIKREIKPTNESGLGTDRWNTSYCSMNINMNVWRSHYLPTTSITSCKSLFLSLSIYKLMFVSTKSLETCSEKHAFNEKAPLKYCNKAWAFNNKSFKLFSASFGNLNECMNV